MKYSYHVHSTYSDGIAPIGEIVDYAEKLELDEVGISDHFHIPADGNFLSSDMHIDLLDKYVSEVLSYSSRIKPKVKLGLEVEYVSLTFEQLKKKLLKYPFDYFIGSVHLVFNSIVDDPNKKVSQKYINEIMKEYWPLVKKMAESKFFDIVGHIDLPKKGGIKPTIDLSKEIMEALEAIKKADMTVELNTSGWHYPCKEQYPSVDILKKCKMLDIPIIVSADAHNPKDLLRDFDKAFKLLKEIGFTKRAYFEKRQRFFTSL